MSLHPLIHIHYLRPPDRTQVFDQTLVLDHDDVKVTLAEGLGYDPPLRIDGRVALEKGSDVVWFTFPGRWHDIGRFHRADGTFTGLYANILTPPILNGDRWDTTDLYLDVWVRQDGSTLLLDEDELDEALRRGWIDADTAVRARDEARRLLDGACDGTWPPVIVDEWTLERCREVLGRR